MATINEVLRIEDQFSSTMTRFNALGAKMVGVVAGIAGAGALTAGGMIALSDSITQTTARLEAIKGEFSEVADLQNAIFAAAQRSRGSYADMAASVASFKAQTGDVFKSTAEAVRFTELLNKQFALSGTSAAGVQSTMYNLTQALATGTLRGNDLQMVLSNAPALIQKIGDYLGKDIGEIRNLAQEGQITADIVKAAIMGAGDDIDAQFAKMPMTFGQAMNQIRNVAMKSFEPIAKRISTLINSADFQQAMLAIANGIQTAMNIAIAAFELFAKAVIIVRDNLNTIAPIIGVIVGAMVAYNAAVGIATAVTGAYNVAMGIAATAKAIYTAATAAATAGQSSFNAALAACPITWVVAAIIAAIAVVIGLIVALHNLADTGHTIFGDLAGVIFGVFSSIANLLAIVANAFISAAEFVVNAWNTGVYNIQLAIYNFVVSAAEAFNSVIDAADGAATALANAFVAGANTAIGAVNGIIGALNKIPGINIGTIGTLGQVSSVISGRIDTSGLKAPTAPTGSASFGRFETTTMGEAFSKGFERGAAAGDKAQNGLVDAITGLKGNLTDLMGAENNLAYQFEDAAGTLGGLSGGGGGGGKANIGTVDKVKDVHLSDEDLKVYRDLAERRYMANVELQTLAPNISVSIPESAAKNLTSQDIADKLKIMLIDQAAAHTAVAHAH